MKSGHLAAAAVVLTGLLFPIQSWIDARRAPRPSSFLYMPNPRLMRVIACGHGPLLAELVWIHSNNYVISQFKLRRNHMEYLYGLYDTITELDPDAVNAYVLGAVFLSAVAQEPDQSLKLLQKGQGGLVEINGKYTEDPKIPGLVNPENPLRWKLLDEFAATYLVVYAPSAPTADERQEEVRRAGRLYLFGADRYPVSRYPSVPDWFHAMGMNLSHRKLDAIERAQYHQAINYFLDTKIFAAGPDSPVAVVLKRTKVEIELRGRFEDLEQVVQDYDKAHPDKPATSLDQLLVKNGGPLAKLPEDPLGTGFLMRDGHVVAPALDAALVQRTYARHLGEYHLAQGVWPSSLDVLRTDLERRGVRAPQVPPWVVVEYDASTGEIKARGER